MITGIGTDIVEIARIVRAILRHNTHFIERILTEKEIAYCRKHRQFETHFAGRFAAKEAISKALGCGIGETLSWHDIEIVNDSLGKPCVNLSLKAKEHFKEIKIELSISHNKTQAIAFAIAMS